MMIRMCLSMLASRSKQCESQANSMRNGGERMTSKENVQPHQASRSELQARIDEMEEYQLKTRTEMAKLQKEKLQQHQSLMEEAEKLNGIVSKTSTFTEERSEHELLSKQALVVSATKSAYRVIKFLNNEGQAQMFGEKVMDLTKLVTLHVDG
jgi:hypothetical protein